MLRVPHKWIVTENVTDCMNQYGYTIYYEVELKVLANKCKYCHKVTLHGSIPGRCNSSINHTMTPYYYSIGKMQGFSLPNIQLDNMKNQLEQSALKIMQTIEKNKLDNQLGNVIR